MSTDISSLKINSCPLLCFCESNIYSIAFDCIKDKVVEDDPLFLIGAERLYKLCKVIS